MAPSRHWEPTARCLPTCRPRKLLLRRDRHLGDILRNPGFPALHVGTIERLELAFREGMRRRLFDQCLGPALEPWISVDDTERLNAIEEEIALQERRIGGVHQRVFRAVEERAHRALPLQRAFKLLESRR